MGLEDKKKRPSQLTDGTLISTLSLMTGYVNKMMIAPAFMKILKTLD